MRSVFDLRPPRVADLTAESVVDLVRPPIPGFGSFMNRAGLRHNMEQAEQVGSLWGILDTRATTLSGVEWTLYRRTGPRRIGSDRADDNRVPVEVHAALDVWEQPTEWHDQEEWLKLWSMWRDLTGESYCVPTTLNGRPDGQPIELWPVWPDQMWPISHERKYLAGWMHRSPDGTDTPLDPAQVKQWRSPHPIDPHRGLGPVQALMADLESLKAGAAWNLNFFLNSALPGGIIEAPGEVSEPDWIRFKKRWNETHHGVQNAHKVALLEGATWKDRQMTMRDMEFVKLREFGDDQLRQAFGMSKTMQGMNEHDNRASAATARHTYGLARDIPRLNELRRWLNRWYLPRFGATARQLEFDYDRSQVLPEDADQVNADRDSRINGAATLIGLGADPTETLEAFDLPIVTFERETGQPVMTPPGEEGETGGGSGDGGGELNEVDGLDPVAMATFLQKLYLSVGVVVSTEESRRMARAAGMDLDEEIPEELVKKPAPPPVMIPPGPPPADPDPDEDPEDDEDE